MSAATGNYVSVHNSGLEALRILKRRLSDVIYNAMLNDTRARMENAA